MKEYGGYLAYEEYTGSPYHTNALAFDSARSSVEYFCYIKQIKKVFYPYYLCEHMAKILLNRGINVEKYHIDSNFMPVVNKSTLKENELLIVVNYYGQLDDDKIIYLKNKYKSILIDNTQNFFSIIKNIPSICSCRKYFGVPDGAYLYIDEKNIGFYSTLKREVAYDHVRHLIGRLEINAMQFYSDYKKREDLIHETGIKRMSFFSENILKSLDYKAIILKRKANYKALDNCFSDINLMEVKNHGGLFLYPLLIKNGKKLKEKLIDHNIYVPTLWPELLVQRINDFEKMLVDHLVLLPIDQHYDTSDMQEIIEIVNRCIKEIPNNEN